MIIGINALTFDLTKAGISTYADNLISGIINSKEDNLTLLLFLPKKARGYFPKRNNVRYLFFPTKTIFIRILIEQILVPFFSILFRCDFVHSLANCAPVLLGKKNIVTIHDIYYIHYPARFNFVKRNYLRLFVRLSVFLSRRIITVSHCTKNDLITHFSLSESSKKIDVIYEGYSNLDSTAIHATALKTEYNITKPFFLFVGTIEPGKNILSLIKAFQNLPNTFQLVVAGKWGWQYKDILDYICEHKLDQKVVFTGYISDNMLATLYKNACALIYPPFHEGFGLPLIEAMSLNCPVCCSNTSCMPEIAEEAAIFFNPYSIKEIKSAMLEILKKEKRASLIKKGERNIARFSWNSLVSQTLKIYHDESKG